MDHEQLIREIMAEVMKSLGGDQVSSTGTVPVSAPPAGLGPTGKRVGREHYPLAEKHPELIGTNSGLTLDELTFPKVVAGELSASDFRISSETLELQAQVAEASGRQSLARNLRRAAELVPVPDERVLEIYDALRPYRSTKAELHAIATDLEDNYGATISAGFVREAADVYEARGRLRAG